MVERIAGPTVSTAATSVRRTTTTAGTTGTQGAARAATPARAFSMAEGQPATTVAPAPSDPAPSSLGRTLKFAMNRLERQRATIDRAIQDARSGRAFSPGELLALQSQIYTYSQELEVVSRMVDRTVSTLKTTLNTQL